MPTVTELREQVRSGAWSRSTAGQAPGFAQANVVVLPAEDAFSFLLFCQRNPQPCPVLEVLEPGEVAPRRIAPNADIRTDVPRYRVYERGDLVEELTDITDRWRDDFVTFLIGCSYTADDALAEAGIPLRNIEQGGAGPMYSTSVACVPAGRFEGPLVVSMRPMMPRDVIRATEITSRLRQFHGAPVHAGDPEAIGIADLDKPAWGEPVTIQEGEIPVFWACGVTPQAVAAASGTELMITHAPGHMFVASVKAEELEC